jgi:aldose 1-epimerase
MGSRSIHMLCHRHKCDICPEYVRPATGEIRDASSKFDLRGPTEIVAGFDTRDTQLLAARGFDHYFFLNNPGEMSSPAAILHSPASGLKIRFFTSQSGVQVYTGNFLPSPFQRHGAICSSSRTRRCA